MNEFERNENLSNGEPNAAPNPETPAEEPSVPQTEPDAQPVEQPEAPQTAEQPEAPAPEMPTNQPESFTNPFAEAPKQAPSAPSAQPYTYQAPSAPTYGSAPQPQYANPNPNMPPYMQNMYAPAQPQNINKIIAKKVAIWVVAVVLELILLLFAVIGVYSVATGALWKQKSNANNTQNTPNLPSQSRIEQQEGTSSVEPQNNADVQLGITCTEMSDEMAEFYQLEKGLIIQKINEDSNANDVDLELYDVITHCNGVRVQTFQNLFDELEKMKVGDTVTLTVYRVDDDNNAGEPFEVSFEVQKRQAQTESSASSKSAKVYPFA